MPPKGLYRIPKHHVVGQGTSMKRQSFNSMDFKEAEKPARVTTNDSTTDDFVNNERAQRKREKRERKEARKLKKEAKAAMAAAETGKLKEKQNTPPVDPTPTATPVKNGRDGPRGPYKKREKGPDGTPVSAAKKRKRETEVPVDSPAVTGKGLADADNWLGPNFKKNMEDNKKSLARLASIFDQQINENAKPTESPRNKPGRPVGSGKKAIAKTIETEIPKASDTTKKAIKSDEIKRKAKRQKLEKTPVASNEENVSKVSKTPIPVPSVASALPTEPKSTPVPLPQKSLGALTRSVSESPTKKNKVDLRESEVLVSETPLSQMSRTPATTPRVQAIPFSLRPAVTTSKETSKAPGTLESSPEIPLMIDTKSPEARKRIVGSQGSVNPLTNSQVDSLTTANLMRFKEPLRDTPKPRPRGRRSVSEAPSTSSSSSSTTSRTIRDMLMRPNKPYTRPSNEISPFNNKKKHIEKHDEANLATFSSTFTASRRTVNFTDEAAYLDEYDEWLSDSEAAGTLPCLKQASGCSAKSEQLLQLQRSDDTSAFKVIITNETETENTASDIARVKAASTFLRYSILTRIPIPLGSIEGTFKLYCPKYTATHVDKYGFGQRTLNITSIAGLNPMSGAYTARLSIPPRSMPYPIQAFEAPPHASFRTITLKTVAERYRMDVMFLGNGYLKLRVDLHLILNGKSAGEMKAAKGKGKEGKTKAGVGVWEFLGVNEKAVVWEPTVDELEKEGRKLIAKYEGR
ncbi:hypothetical protein AA0111_g9308 [Alternaria arborescens]|uniref:hypothetical protein n=1 Tax=Alternaria arborescens TaxID=156630 RepID=UPI0010752A3C|nr:hypothetical protein AA0111_g9308 [Alternaria arborescens]RYO22764.1 hypothetical protein AA0111_g9308 [Alternaria arborescens]